MSLTSTDFWVLFDFALAEIMYVFALADSVVIVDEPRFTIWSTMISILFLGLVVGVLNWLRGHNVGAGGTNWDYIMHRGDGLRDVTEQHLDDSFLRANRRQALENSGGIVRYVNNVQQPEENPAEDSGFLRDFVARRRVNVGHRRPSHDRKRP
jgi:hypothetical protein